MNQNKYHPEGGEYTPQEMRGRHDDLRPTYVFGAGHANSEIGKTFAKGRNAVKRAKAKARA